MDGEVAVLAAAKLPKIPRTKPHYRICSELPLGVGMVCFGAISFSFPSFTGANDAFWMLIGKMLTHFAQYAAIECFPGSC